MKILIIDRGGFIGRNLVENLKNIRDGKDRTRPALQIGEIRACAPGDLPTAPEGDWDSVFDLSGPDGLRLYRHAPEAGRDLYLYRVPEVTGKWARPGEGGTAAELCRNAANGLPFVPADPDRDLELLFVEDLVAEMLDALEGRPHRVPGAADGEKGVPCKVPVTYRTTPGAVSDLLRAFLDQPRTLFMPSIPPGSLAKKLYSMYLSFLPPDRAAYDLSMKRDGRGSFTELLKTADRGQISVNVSRPGVTKGMHWHNGKWELFVVVSGHALIRERQIGTGEVTEFEVTGEQLRAVYMLPGYTHSIVNLSGSENLVTVMWANEPFDPEHPDTFYEEV